MALLAHSSPPGGTSSPSRSSDVLLISSLVRNLAHHCFGPYGQHVLVSANFHVGFNATLKASSLAVNRARLDHPLAKLFASASLAAHKYGDGGWLALLLACSVAHDAVAEGERAAPLTTLHYARGVQEAIGWCLAALDRDPNSNVVDGEEEEEEEEEEDGFLPGWMRANCDKIPQTTIKPATPVLPPPPPPLKLRISFQNVQGMLALARGVLWPRQSACNLSHEDVEQACVALCKAVVMAADARGGTGVVRVSRAPGNHAGNTRAIFGTILDGAVAPGTTYALRRRLLPVRTNARCVLITSSIDFVRSEEKDAEHGDAVLADAQAVAMNGSEVHVRATKRRAMLADAAACFGLGSGETNRTVDVVFCQKIVHPSIQAYLARHGILVVERLGTNGAALVSRLTRARSMPDLTRLRIAAESCDGLDPVVGTIGSLDAVTLSVGTANLHLTAADDGGGVATVLACAPTEAACDELAHAITQARDVLQSCTGSPYAVPGGGCTEALLACHVRKRAAALMRAPCRETSDSFARSAKRAVERGRHAVATALELAVTRLAPPVLGDGSGGTSHAARIARANDSAHASCKPGVRRYLGFDASAGGELSEVALSVNGELQRGSVVDYAPAKRAALSAAREIIMQAVRMHAVVSEV